MESFQSSINYTYIHLHLLIYIPATKFPLVGSLWGVVSKINFSVLHWKFVGQTMHCVYEEMQMYIGVINAALKWFHLLPETMLAAC